jgi:hypothetical protein
MDLHMPCLAKRCCQLLILAIASFLGQFSDFACADLLVSGYQDRLHDPYYVGADKAFIGQGYNWSGVGRIADPAGGSSNWKSLTMISDNYFITANHFKPNRGDDPAGSAPKVRFYRTTDPNGEFWESEIATVGNGYDGTRIGLTDLWVGKLANTPPDWVMRYPLAKRHEATNYLSYTDNKLFVFGQDSPRSFTSLRVGRNQINQVELGGNYSWDYDPKNGLGADEAQTQGGDSGSPSFFSDGRVPVLAGMHTRTNYDTGISKNLQQIVDAVGEPISVSTGIVGDLNGSFRVNATDFFTMAANYGRSGTARYYQGDITGDGNIDVHDYMLLYTNYGRNSYAPADFNQDGRVDGSDLVIIGHNWLKYVSTPFAAGDANGDTIVNFKDIEIFDHNQFRAYFGSLPAPLSAVDGDTNDNGVVDGFDLSIVTSNLNKLVLPGTNGDADGNGVVNSLDIVFVSTRLGNSFGDLDGDHEVGPGDFVILANNWNKRISGGRLTGDLNGDGWVASADAKILFDWWGHQNGEFPGMLMPEPASWMLVVGTAIVAVGATRSRYFSRAILR